MTPSRSWRVIGLHHVAFAHSADRATETALREMLGLEVGHAEPGDGFIERMVPVAEGCYVQLLEATGAGVVERFVESRGSAMHHVAFEVDDVDAAVAELKVAGARLVDDQPREGGLGTKIAFLHPSTFGGLLVELVEAPDRSASDEI